MPDIARIDEDGLLTAVETVVEDEHVTDLAAGKIALDDNHDMRQRLKNYRWDVRRGHFIPLSMEPLAEAERETPELVEGIVEAIEHIYGRLGKKEPAVGRLAAVGDGGTLEQPSDLVMPERTKRVFDKFRRVVPRREPKTIEVSSETRAAAEASLANNPPALPDGVEASSATKSENAATLSTAAKGHKA
jgi:hypothetical protein